MVGSPDSERVINSVIDIWPGDDEVVGSEVSGVVAGSGDDRVNGAPDS